jgi:hypothetical protein
MRPITDRANVGTRTAVAANPAMAALPIDHAKVCRGKTLVERSKRWAIANSI